jgi:hypothetical protein
MTDKWNTTDESDEFIASSDSRETSPEIMRAIAFFATNLEEAEAIWAEPEATGLCTMTDIWEHATGNGHKGDGSDLCWGAAGSRWMDA